MHGCCTVMQSATDVTAKSNVYSKICALLRARGLGFKSCRARQNSRTWRRKPNQERRPAWRRGSLAPSAASFNSAPCRRRKAQRRSATRSDIVQRLNGLASAASQRSASVKSFEVRPIERIGGGAMRTCQSTRLKLPSELTYDVS